MDGLTITKCTGYSECQQLLQDNEFKEILEMSPTEAEFLFYIIKKFNPKNLLEIGIAAGGSSLLLLEAIKNQKDAVLYSIDCCNLYYRDKSLKTGYFAKRKIGSTDKWKTYTGGLAYEYMDTFDKKFDFVLLDTRHMNPGELLDFLMVYPYMSENAVLVLHDTAMHTLAIEMQRSITNCLLMSAINGEKYIPETYEPVYFPSKHPTERLHVNKRCVPNIGAIKIDNKLKNNIYNVFNLLSLPWYYFPEAEKLSEIGTFLQKHYDKKYIALYESTVNYQLQVKTIKEEIKNTENSYQQMKREIINMKNSINKLEREYLKKEFDGLSEKIEKLQASVNLIEGKSI